MISKSSIKISVCICTYKRALLLKRLMGRIAQQVTNGIFEYDAIVIDNDKDRSAERIIHELQEESYKSFYYSEPRNSIPLARNLALSKADGDFIAFIDDDEFPPNEWLLNLYLSWKRYQVAGVLGPVLPYFEKNPPKWILRGELFKRPSYDTGTVLKWWQTRAGNALISKKIIESDKDIFNSNFRHSEDQEFFKRMIKKGHVFVWCNEAPVYEIQTENRFELSYFLKRALLRGNVSFKLLENRYSGIAKSVAAIILYFTILPGLAFAGRHYYAKYLIKSCDHFGRIAAVFGIDFQKRLT